MGRNLNSLSVNEINPLKYSLTTRFKERHFIEFLRPKPEDTILDLGCGIGYLLSLFNSSEGQLYGMDMSWESVLAAKKYVQGYFIRGDGQELPFKEDTFDKVIFADVIEHVPDDNASIKEIVRVSRRNAKIVISTPALEGLITRTWLKHWLHREEDRYQKDHRLGYTDESLRDLVEFNNIKIDRIRYTNYYLTEILIGVLKLAFFTKKRYYDSQYDLVSISNNKVFQIYRRFVFPIFYGVGKVEEKLFKNIIKGHCLILCGTVKK